MGNTPQSHRNGSKTIRTCLGYIMGLVSFFDSSKAKFGLAL